MADLAFESLSSQADLLKSKQVSPVELARTYLDRIERLNDKLRSFITVTGDQALESARTAEREIAQDRYLGPLHGIPIGIKDQFDTEGVRTTHGSSIYSENVPQRDCTVVSRLKAAGALILGKLNMTEFAFGDTRNYPHGTPRNPWDLDRYPGGSSAGSGSSVVAGLCSASIGEDTGGSVRLPASMCGIVGIRPTFGRISRYGVFPMCWSMDIAGPMTRTVKDCALLLWALAGYDPNDRLSSRQPVPDYTRDIDKGIDGLRIGYLKEQIANEEVDAEVRRATEKALEVMDSLGAQVTEVSIPLLSLAGPIYVATCDSDAADVHGALLRERGDEYDPGARTRLAAASLIPAVLYHKAQRARELLRRRMSEALDTVDALVSPTMANPPPTIEEATRRFSSEDEVRERVFGARANTTPYNLAGFPAMSIPCGFTKSGLPIGLQVGGRPFEEAMLFRVAAAYERATDWHTLHPTL